jgi:hypothetical protein
MRQHIDVVGILFMAYGGLQLLGALALGAVFLFLGLGLGAAGASGGEEELMVMGGIYGVVGLVAAVLAGLFAVPNLIVGNGIRGRKPWARMGGLVMGALALLNMPLGTILGIYAFMTLIDKDVTAEFEGRA